TISSKKVAVPLRSKSTRLPVFGAGMFGVALLLVLWQIYALVERARTVGTGYSIPTVDEVLFESTSLLTDPFFYSVLFSTFGTWFVGLTASVLLAVPLGILLGMHPRIYRMIRIPVELLRPLPPIVLLPIAFLILGSGLEFQVVLIMQGAFWPLFIQTTYGVAYTDKTLIETMQVYRIGKIREAIFVRGASALPIITTALKIGAAAAFAIAIMTEFIGGANGIGRDMLTAQAADDVTRTYLLTFVCGVCGMAIMQIFGWVENYAAKFAPGE